MGWHWQAGSIHVLFFAIVFNLGEYRRQATTAYRNHDFFRSDNEEAMRLRNKCAEEALEDLSAWIDDGGEVAVSPFL